MKNAAYIVKLLLTAVVITAVFSLPGQLVFAKTKKPVKKSIKINATALADETPAELNSKLFSLSYPGIQMPADNATDTPAEYNKPPRNLIDGSAQKNSPVTNSTTTQKTTKATSTPVTSQTSSANKNTGGAPPETTPAPSTPVTPQPTTPVTRPSTPPDVVAEAQPSQAFAQKLSVPLPGSALSGSNYPPSPYTSQVQDPHYARNLAIATAMLLIGLFVTRMKPADQAEILAIQTQT